jgi:hypothetical protein
LTGLKVIRKKPTISRKNKIISGFNFGILIWGFSFAIKQILQTPNIKIKIEKKFNKILLYGKNKTIGNSTNIRKFTAIKIF